jgi:hypothetical protein
MDDAYCGGGDTNEGLTNTAISISVNAQKKIAAAIFLGDPRHIPGLSYNVGTCQASGVRPHPIPMTSASLNQLYSSRPARPGSNARSRPTSNHTVMRQTPSAAMETTPTRIRATPSNTALSHSRL